MESKERFPLSHGPGGGISMDLFRKFVALEIWIQAISNERFAEGHTDEKGGVR